MQPRCRLSASKKVASHHIVQINESLRWLDVGEADIDIPGFISFTTVLTNNRTLKSINLDRPICGSLQVCAHCCHTAVIICATT